MAISRARSAAPALSSRPPNQPPAVPPSAPSLSSTARTSPAPSTNCRMPSTQPRTVQPAAHLYCSPGPVTHLYRFPGPVTQLSHFPHPFNHRSTSPAQSTTGALLSATSPVLSITDMEPSCTSTSTASMPPGVPLPLPSQSTVAGTTPAVTNSAAEAHGSHVLDANAVPLMVEYR